MELRPAIARARADHDVETMIGLIGDALLDDLTVSIQRAFTEKRPVVLSIPSTWPVLNSQEG